MTQSFLGIIHLWSRHHWWSRFQWLQGKWAGAGIEDGLRPGIILKIRFRCRSHLTLTVYAQIWSGLASLAPSRAPKRVEASGCPRIIVWISPWRDFTIHSSAPSHKIADRRDRPTDLDTTPLQEQKIAQLLDVWCRCEVHCTRFYGATWGGEFPSLNAALLHSRTRPCHSGYGHAFRS